MRMGQGVRTGLGHGGITCVLQTHFSSFLMKLATWIDSKVENMHIVLICLPNINFGCYGNVK